MKKLLLLLAAAFVLAAGAQARTITPGDNQVWWGYFFENDFEVNENTLGTGSPTTLMAGIYIPAGHEQLSKSTIQAVRIYFDKNVVSSLSGLKIWISKELPSRVAAADYVQSTLGTLTAGANDFRLTKPYEVGDGGFYIGYCVKSTTGYFIRCGGNDADNSFWIGNPEVGMEWQDLTGGGFGKLAFQILAEGGNFQNFCVSAENFKPTPVELGGTVDVPISVSNQGTATVNDLAYTITMGGVTSEEQTVSSLSIPFGGVQKVMFPVPSAETEGTFSYTLTITRVNGEPNTSTNNKAKGNITTVENLKTWPRNVLIEEFTTEYCGYCPSAAAVVEAFGKNYPELTERVAMVCHHDGYYTDWLTIPASSNYLWFYNDGGSTYAPAFMYDRYAWDGKTPVEGQPSGVSSLKARVEQRISQPAYAGIDLNAEWNEDKTKIKVTINVERSWKFSTTPARLTIFLTEDNITAHSQSGASGIFVHQHVLRAVNQTWGYTLSWKDNKSTYTYTFTPNASWKADDLKVIAIVSGYDSKNPTNCTVENAASASLSQPTAIPMLPADADVPAVIFGADGRRLPSLQKGINIVRQGDGTVKKILRK